MRSLESDLEQQRASHKENEDRVKELEGMVVTLKSSLEEEVASKTAMKQQVQK